MPQSRRQRFATQKAGGRAVFSKIPYFFPFFSQTIDKSTSRRLNRNAKNIVKK
jgi:hypothetical protein